MEDDPLSPVRQLVAAWQAYVELEQAFRKARPLSALLAVGRLAGKRHTQLGHNAHVEVAGVAFGVPYLRKHVLISNSVRENERLNSPGTCCCGVRIPEAAAAAAAAEVDDGGTLGGTCWRGAVGDCETIYELVAALTASAEAGLGVP